MSHERTTSFNANTASPVLKKILSNGMTLLVHEVHSIPKVSLQVWYNVGSKDEQSGERGIAHLLEHMVFKGTKTLSESDINVITHKLSGSANAFTSYDYTGYLFNMPTQHYKDIFPVFADCMINCRFDDQMLNSEVKAVIQELKLYKDQYTSSLLEQMIGTIFSDHPYHHPIIGYKQDLWTVAGKNLHEFYKKHYCPNNATLVVVGDVQSEEVFKLAEEHFGPIPANPNHIKHEYFFNQDISSKSVTLYRDVQQPCLAFAVVAPGASAKQEHVLNLTEWILGKGKGSRLYKKLVNELQLVTSIEVGSWDLFDHGLFFIACEPKNIADAQKIEDIIFQECADIAHNGITDQEFERALKKAQSSLYSLLEDIEDQAYAIGKSYLATGDQNYLFNYLDIPHHQIKTDIHNFIRTSFRPSIVHKGAILPLDAEEHSYWNKLQELSDQEDEAILSARIRNTSVEPADYAHTIAVQEPVYFNYPKPEVSNLRNGLTIFSYASAIIPKISIVLSFKSNSLYDPQDKQGLCNFVSCMLTEGSQKYSSDELADLLESKGMSINAYPGGIMLSVLKEDFIQGLEILKELVTNVTFPKHEVEKVREHILADIKNYWDDARSFATQLVKERLYKNHPYSKNALGTTASINAISDQDLFTFYQNYATPYGAKIAIVGDMSDYNLKEVVDQTLGSWNGPEVQDIIYPELQELDYTDQNYFINRDQVVLTIAKRSIPRIHPDYNALLLFDQIFGSGVLGSMSSRLFELREQSGLFYSIDGSFLSNAYEQPGMLHVKTIVSLDRLQEAEKVIKHTIITAIDTLEKDEFLQAKQALINSSVDNFSSHMSCARTFLYLDRFNLPHNYFDTRAQELEKISISDVCKAVKRILGDNQLFALKIGRVQ